MAKATGRVCMPGHNYIYEPPLMRCRQMLEDGELGACTALSAAAAADADAATAAHMMLSLQQGTVAATAAAA